MKPGDKVRMIHGREEGRIIRILPQQQVEIEIEDGFRIPVLMKEVVVVSKAESEYLHADKGIEEVPEQTQEGTGLWLGVHPFNDNIHSFYLINDTTYHVQVVCVSKQGNDDANFLFSGLVHAQKAEKIFELNLESFSSWPEVALQGLRYKNKSFPYLKPFEVSFHFKADTFFKRKAMLPLLQKNGYLFALEVEKETLKLEALKHALNENREHLLDNNRPGRPMSPVDLHIEKLSNETQLSNSEKLKLQLDTFQKALDAALVHNMEEIIFIHGVGNGILKNELHKRLSQTKGIKYFEDAAKEKFGYGATKVKIR
jgi:hypothetical protein